MADPKDTNTTSFFRKVVKFVANPATEWADLNQPTQEARDNDLARAELKAMIERKRRNDFVRKREFDMLRKVRREGLTSEQLAALGTSSRLDDSDAKMPETVARQDSGVKAKIDEIEQQMVGSGSFGGQQHRPPEFYSAPTQAADMNLELPAAFVEPDAVAEPAQPAAQRPPAAPPGPAKPARPAAIPPAIAPAPSAAAPRPVVPALALDLIPTGFTGLPSADVSEVVHDPDLDEAVIAFANADFEQCEQSLIALTADGAPRAHHAETWLVLFDLYRATGQQYKFDTLALDYAQQFGWSAPQWFSMPKMVADAATEDRSQARAPADGQIGWVSPEWIDSDMVIRLRSQTLQLPLPWVFDWSALRGIEPEASARLSELFRTWIPQKLDMRWLGGDRLFAVLADAAPTGVRDADPVYWQLRLDALRMTNRPDQFDEAAIDYCVTYEVSPPSWEPAVCQARVSGTGRSTLQSPMSKLSEVSTSFVESKFFEGTDLVQMAGVDLSGQLVGDIGLVLRKLDTDLGQASIIHVSCAQLIRVDFIAAGDLLNWVLSRRSENRSVSFIDAHRLIALFFGAMGINEHAKIKVRTV